jgi:hypothetical protein
MLTSRTGRRRSPLVQDLAAHRRHLEQWLAAYPDLRLEIVTLFAAGSPSRSETPGTRGIASSSCGARLAPRSPTFTPSLTRRSRLGLSITLRMSSLARRRGLGSFGPFASILVWRTRGIERLDEWDAPSSSRAGARVGDTLQGMMITEAASFYRGTAPRLDRGVLYIETFAPHESPPRPWLSAHDARRALGPRPGMIRPHGPGSRVPAGSLSSRSRRGRRRPDARMMSWAASVAAGLHAPLGREVL